MTSVTIATEKGDIDVDLFTTDAPKASKNFVDLARKGFYDDVVFHRVIPGFVAQAGDGEHGKKASLNTSRVGTGGGRRKVWGAAVKGGLRAGGPRKGESGPDTHGGPMINLQQGPNRHPHDNDTPLRHG